jgi:hypothetical protein
MSQEIEEQTGLAPLAAEVDVGQEERAEVPGACAVEHDTRLPKVREIAAYLADSKNSSVTVATVGGPRLRSLTGYRQQRLLEPAPTSG